MIHKAEIVWGAAAAAQRINGAYIKQDTYENGKLVMRANKYILFDFLDHSELLSDSDMDAGAEVRKYYHTLTFKMLGDRYMSDFDKTALKIAEKEEISSARDIAIIASLPASMLRAKERDSADIRIRYATGGFIGTIKEKVEIEVEIIKCIFSVNYNTYYITAITPNDQVVFFSYKTKLDSGAKLRIKGTVVAHRSANSSTFDISDSTKLNRVKVLTNNE